MDELLVNENKIGGKSGLNGRSVGHLGMACTKCSKLDLRPYGKTSNIGRSSFEYWNWSSKLSLFPVYLS